MDVVTNAHMLLRGSSYTSICHCQEVKKKGNLAGMISMICVFKRKTFFCCHLFYGVLHFLHVHGVSLLIAEALKGFWQAKRYDQLNRYQGCSFTTARELAWPTVLKILEHHFVFSALTWLQA